jgi:energy-converting hydrogenase Eha subunit A
MTMNKIKFFWNFSSIFPTIMSLEAILIRLGQYDIICTSFTTLLALPFVLHCPIVCIYRIFPNKRTLLMNAPSRGVIEK